jgi:biotin carboxyl carrier protein
VNEGQHLPLEDVGRLVDLLRESGLGEIQVRHGDLEITVKAGQEAPVVQAAPRTEAQPAPEPVAEDPERNGLHAFRSPLVGTF